MRALVWHGPGQMSVDDVPDPEPAAGEVLLAPEAVGICGSELEGYLGHQANRTPPLVMGHEFAGRVVAVGEGVEEQPLLAGDHSGDEDLRATTVRRDAQADAALAEVLGSGGRLFAGELERERSLELTARMVRHGLLGLTAWWREHPGTPRAVLVDHAMAVTWTGLRALRKNGR